MRFYIVLSLCFCTLSSCAIAMGDPPGRQIRFFRLLGISNAIETGDATHFEKLMNELDAKIMLEPVFLKAAEFGNEEMIESLIRRGAIIDGIGNRTMFYAAMNNNDKVVDLMIKHGGNVNAADDRGNTLLHLAALNSDVKVVETLLKNGANLDTTNQDKESVLHWAAVNPSVKMVDFLIKSGANIHSKNKDAETPLAVASMLNTNEQVIESLIKAGSNVTETNFKGWTPVICAIVNGNNLIREGIRDSDIQYLPLTILETKRKECVLNHWNNPVQKHAGEKIIEVLINNGVNINQKLTADEITAYDAAEIIGDESMKQFLIKHGANAGKP